MTADTRLHDRVALRCVVEQLMHDADSLESNLSDIALDHVPYGIAVDALYSHGAQMLRLRASLMDGVTYLSAWHDRLREGTTDE